MSRAISILERLVCNTGFADTAIHSIGVTNLPRREDGTLGVVLSFNLANSKIDEFLYKTLLTVGSYSSDSFSIIDESGVPTVISEIKELEAIEKIGIFEINLSNESKPITSPGIVNALTANTLFGLPGCLLRGIPIASLKIFFGVNRSPIQIVSRLNESPSAYNGRPYIFSRIQKPIVRFRYLDKNNNFKSKDVSIKNYLSDSLRLEMERHSYIAKWGLVVDAVFPPSEFESDVPLLGWAALLTKAGEIVSDDLKGHLEAQVARINARVIGVHRRPRLSRSGLDFGLEPSNEVETVLLFQRLLYTAPNAFPPGFQMQILDYSPRDIDSISQFQISDAHPVATGPVEFEYAIRSFFDHGHDYRQVQMIVCYTLGDMSFPYSKGGIEYSLQSSGTLPTLSNSKDTKAIPCLILERMFK
jgi:hypothetical protein